jgi:hypothetical protein
MLAKSNRASHLNLILSLVYLYYALALVVLLNYQQLSVYSFSTLLAVPTLAGIFKITFDLLKFDFQLKLVDSDARQQSRQDSGGTFAQEFVVSKLSA